MNLETVTCARCGDRVPLDVDHGKVTLETVRMDDANGDDRYALCMDCVIAIRGDWTEPV